MCGIAGLMRFDGQEPSRESLKRMTDVIAHRGPDDSGFLTEGGIGLGFRRLSIIDLREGHQPLCNEDESVWIIFNGEIYNYKELRATLEARGHVFRTHSDTETIVHLYEEYGEECVKMLRGMFGFVIWDRNKRMLFGARDHFGIKPFYYHYSSEQFVFGSEIKSLLEAEGIERQVNTDGLMNYLTFQYVPEPDTMFAGIQKLRPAHYIKVTADGKMTQVRYWDPMLEPENREFDDYVEEIRAKLMDSVSHHLVSDVERGCFLSSGIDSTAMAAHMSRIEPIRTFSVGFEGANNETIIARESANAMGTQHYDRIISQKDYFDSLPKAIWHQDEPVADPSAIALYHLAQLAREHVTVVLSGEGADELFGGYRIYREPLSLKPIETMPAPLKRLLRKMALALPGGAPGRNYILRGTTPLTERFIGNAKIFSEDLKADVLKTGAEKLGTYKNPYQIAAEYYEKTRHLDPVTRMQYIDMNLWLPGDILMKADKMTMAHSLELRVPFLDKDLYELTRKIPVDYRLGGGTTKYIFRKAMEGIIPSFILDRPKLGFPVPMRDWLRGPQGKTVLEQIEAGGIGDYINLSTVESMLAKHQSGQGDYARRLWVIYVFALWHSTYMLPESSRAFAAV
ncbi:asparagine synthase (glutamine-hydrolyzing) [Gorillibacterium massiliense]|uniref:asparagine synthase (glutamine-hydrolyzing) n=1 Tax=Gorillibacterium massiliense TaxID=1280390 RepID=UPI0004AF3D67|nr:asparagine synthase (glutamine-hydrolyzing) [Gorillibacterium massiliense]